MPQERFFISQELTLGGLIRIEGPECHHLVTVMRGTLGTKVELVNGLGTLAQAKITRIEKKYAELLIESIYRQNKEDVHPLILLQAIPKLNRLEYIIEKGTELGMSALYLFPGERSEKKVFSDNQTDRFYHLAIAAMKQCGRLFLPEIKLMPPISLWEKEETSLPLFYGSLDPAASLLIAAVNPQGHLCEGVQFCVGPEGGLTPAEEAALQALGGIGVKLHKNILRTETAAIAGLTILSHLQEM